jgi:hypothetical protein
MKKYIVYDSQSGDELGIMEIPEEQPDETILADLITAGYLHGSADDYEIQENQPMTDPGELIVADYDGPVLSLTPDDDDGDENGEDDDDDEDDEEIQE